jgi:hypothetical protein
MFLTGKKVFLISSILVAAHFFIGFLATKKPSQELEIYIYSGLLTAPLHLLYLLLIFYICQRLWNFSRCLRKN